MTRYVIGPDVAIRLAQDRVSVPVEHQLLAPALLRSQVVARLAAAVEAVVATAPIEVLWEGGARARR